MMTVVFTFKKTAHRVWGYLKGKIAFAVTAFK